ncbi:Subunit of heteropentameric Replication factor C (RF-C) [Basidiobolus ranarum]|uniref:Subunit of heteropentameric Replication factor C (RF-C) n=1 Tax=Basidiobolus ranarum TaxID=34480 RepID=A0ABR2VMV9_9FUNG
MSFFQKVTTTKQPNKDVDSKPWVEKYRPKKMDDISSQEETVNVLKRTLESHNLPHLLFYGPPGTGKTSTILALARELYGPELVKSRVLELNASDERGIGIVREKVKNFARTAVTQSVPGYPCPPYKLIILDEADSMTTDAQAALRRTMETYSKITRFCLICNYVSRIIEPLASRCAKFRFKPLAIESSIERVNYVCEQEGIRCSKQAIDTLVKVANGDLRRAIMYLQSAHRLYKNVEIIDDHFQEIAGVIPNEVIQSLMSSIRSNSYDEISQAVKEVIWSGYSGTQILAQLHEAIVEDLRFTSIQKAKMALVLSDVDKCLVDGGDEHLQVLDLVMQVGAISAN